MNLNWTTLSPAQRTAVSLLCRHPVWSLSRELAEQLLNLGIAEEAGDGNYCISAFGSTLAPPAR